MLSVVLIVIFTALLSLVGRPSVNASSLLDRDSGTEQMASGVITGITGAPLVRTVNGTKHDLSLGTSIAIGEVRTGQDEFLEFLWARRAMVLIGPRSTVRIQEPHVGQTVVSLSDGSVRVALAYHGAPTDMVTIQTPSSGVYTRGGILEVDVLVPVPWLVSRVTSVFAKTNVPVDSTRMETVRVLEGEVGIESIPATLGQSHMLTSGAQARIAAGIVEHTSELFSTASGKSVGLTETDRRQGTPGELTQRLTKIHVTHALEVERQLNTPRPPSDQAGGTTTSDLKGTIISTSLGLSNGFGQSSTTRGPAPASPSAPGPSPTVTPLPPLPPTLVPPIASAPPVHARGPMNRDFLKDRFNDEDKGGKQKQNVQDREQHGSGSVTSLLPTLPNGEISMPTGSDQNQAGGNNSHKVLREFFDDDKG